MMTQNKRTAYLCLLAFLAGIVLGAVLQREAGYQHRLERYQQGQIHRGR